MTLKKLYNDLDTLVDEAMAGARLIANPAYDKYCRQLPNSRILVRTDKYKKPKGLVKLTGGGGAGHEGPPGVMVRPGGNDASTRGDVFAAPSGQQLFRAIKEINDGSPIIMNVANHAGDVLNAKLCAQLCKAAGIDVWMSIGGNDVASAPKGQEDKRRGIGGCFSGTGMMAEYGCSVQEILDFARKCNDNARSYGVGIRSAIHPISGLPIMPMPDDEIELGIGMHGESSGNRIKLPRSRELARMICDILLEDRPIERGTEIALSLGGLGGMTWTELDILYKDIYEYLIGEKGFILWRQNVRNSGTQELGGFVVSIGTPDDEIKKWMSAPLPKGLYPED